MTNQIARDDRSFDFDTEIDQLLQTTPPEDFLIDLPTVTGKRFATVIIFGINFLGYKF